MPVMADFYRHATRAHEDNLRIQEPTGYIKRSREQFQIAIDFWRRNGERINVEEAFVLAEIADKLREGGASEPDYLRAMRHLIAQTIIASARRQKKRTPSAYQDFLIRFTTGPNDDTGIISLNWDILLEQSAPANKIDIDFGYPIGPLDGDVVPAATPHETVKLLKLHGSINWLTCRECSGVWRAAEREIGNYWIGELRLCRKCDQELEPLLVPPTTRKLAKDTLTLLPRLWNEARTLLQRCRVLYLIGYSLPPADTEFKMLLYSALNQSEDLSAIHVVSNRKAGTPRIQFEDHFTTMLNKIEADFTLDFHYEGFTKWSRRGGTILPGMRD